MTLSPTDRQNVIAMAARMIVEELRIESGGDLAELIALPMSAAASMVGLSAQQAGRHLPVTKVSDGKHGVTLANIRKHIASRTNYPKAWPFDPLSPTPTPNENANQNEHRPGHPPRAHQTDAAIA